MRISPNLVDTSGVGVTKVYSSTSHEFWHQSDNGRSQPNPWVNQLKEGLEILHRDERLKDSKNRLNDRYYFVPKARERVSLATVDSISHTKKWVREV